MKALIQAHFYGIGFDGGDHYEIDAEEFLRNEQAVWFHCGRNGADLDVDTHKVLKYSRDLIVQYLENVNLHTFYNDNLDYDDENASKIFLSIEIDELVSVDYTLNVSK